MRRDGQRKSRRWLVAAGILSACTIAADAAHAKESTREARLDLNTATLRQLKQLPGIGAKRAQAIVARRQKAPFRRPYELMQIRGIGKKTYRKLIPWICAGASCQKTAVSKEKASAGATSTKEEPREKR